MRQKIELWIRRHRHAVTLVSSFLLLRLTGDLQIVEALYKKIFPEADSFGAAQIAMVSLPGSNSRGPKVTPEMIHLFLLKHDKKHSEVVTVVTKSPSLIPNPIFVGSLGKEALPKISEGGVPPTRVLLDADLPANCLMAVGATAATHPGKNENPYSFRTKKLVADPVDHSTLTLRTKNEERGLHFLYWIFILSVGGVCLTITPYKSLNHEELRDPGN